MPWKETSQVKERSKFVLEWERSWDEGEGRVNMAALCRAFGVMSVLRIIDPLEPGFLKTFDPPGPGFSEPLTPLVA